MPNLSRTLSVPIRLFTACFALGLLSLMGCSPYENHNGSDPSTLPANRYAGKSCDEILTAVGDDLNAQRDASQEVAVDPVYVEKIRQSSWQLTCKILDYRSIQVDSIQYSCPSQGMGVEPCEDQLSRVVLARLVIPGQSLPYSGIYESQCQIVFPDGATTKLTERFGIISSVDCPFASPGVAIDTQAQGTWL